MLNKCKNELMPPHDERLNQFSLCLSKNVNSILVELDKECIVEIPHSTCKYIMSEIEHIDNSFMRDNFTCENKCTGGFIFHGNVSCENIELKTVLFRHQLSKQFDNLVDNRNHKLTDNWTYDKKKRLYLQHSQNNAKNYLMSIVAIREKEGHARNIQEIDKMLLNFNTMFLHENYRFINMVDSLNNLNKGCTNVKEK